VELTQCFSQSLNENAFRELTEYITMQIKDIQAINDALNQKQKYESIKEKNEK